MEDSSLEGPHYMSDLTDLRTKITSRTAQVMAAINHASGRERSQIAREVLDKWAAQQIHASMIIQRMTRGKGTDGDSSGQTCPDDASSDFGALG